MSFDPEPARADADVEEIERLVAAGATTAAIERLRRRAASHPDEAECRFLLGNLYFDRMWWADGFAAYREAIALDPSYRKHPSVIRNAIRNLMSRSQSWRGSRFLVDEVGAAAIPYLEEAQRGESVNTHLAATRILRQLDRREGRVW